MLKCRQFDMCNILVFHMYSYLPTGSFLHQFCRKSRLVSAVLRDFCVASVNVMLIVNGIGSANVTGCGFCHII